MADHEGVEPPTSGLRVRRSSLAELMVQFFDFMSKKIFLRSNSKKELIKLKISFFSITYFGSSFDQIVVPQ